MMRGIAACALISLLTAGGARPVRAACESSQCPGQFPLRVLDAGAGIGTTMQIPLAWQPVPSATGYIVQRSASCNFSSPDGQYSVSAATNAFGDTGRQPDDNCGYHHHKDG